MKNVKEITGVRSFFSRIFAKKLIKYVNGDPSVYMFGRAKPTPEDPTYFQKWIMKAINEDRSKIIDDFQADPGIDISRMFDEIDLSPEIIMEEDGVSEYELAEADMDRINIRMTYVVMEAAKLLLNKDKNDLNYYTKKLLNDSIPGSYDQLINKLKPNSSNLSEKEKLAHARQKLAYSFIGAVRCCYCQKLQDINLKKQAPLGWDIEVKNFSTDELSTYNANKLTVIKLKDVEPNKYYIYGNTDGSKWELKEIPANIVLGVDFENEKTLPSVSKYSLLHNFISTNKYHTLHLDLQNANALREQKMMNFYMKVISPIETLNRRPINKDSFDVSLSNQQNSEKQYENLQNKTYLINNFKNLLELYKNSVVDDTKLVEINTAIRQLEIRLQDVEVINEFIEQKLPGVDEKINDFLAMPIDNTQKKLIIEAKTFIITNINQKLNDFDKLILSDINLHQMVELEKKRLQNSLVVIQEKDFNHNIDEHFHSPIYLIMKMNEEIKNLNALMHGLDDSELDSEIVDHLKISIIDIIKEFGNIESILKQNDFDVNKIERAQNLLSSSLVNIGSNYAKALKNKNDSQKKSLIADLNYETNLKLNLINLSRYLEDKNAELYKNTIKEISEYLYKLSDDSIRSPNRSIEKLRQISAADMIFNVAEQLNERNKLTNVDDLKCWQLSKKIQSNLKKIENWCSNKNLIISARQNLEVLSEYVEQHNDIYSKNQLNELIDNAKESIKDDMVSYNDSNKIKKILNSDIVKLADLCVLTTGSKSRKKEELDSSLKKLSQQGLTNSDPKKFSIFKFQAFKDLCLSLSKKIDPSDRNRDDKAVFKP